MKPIKVSPLEGVLRFVQVLASGNPYPDEKTVTNTKLHEDTVIIDTCLPPDTNTWETGIMRTKIEGEWVIVEQYPDEETAQKGHENWVKQLTEFPDYPLKAIDMWSLEDFK